MSLPWCVQNFEQPDGPKFEGRYADLAADPTERLKVITWNIQFAEGVDAAIADLRDVAQLRGADVILLQEMDAAGVEAMARCLGYNYVYYPACIHSRHQGYFGNAVLTRWPVCDSGKVRLPHRSPLNRQGRIAVWALIAPGSRRVLAYSAHTETPALSRARRNAQVEALAADIEGKGCRYVLVGGDFNTLTPRSVDYLERRLAAGGMVRASPRGGATIKTSLFDFSLDHIFARGMRVLDTGVWRATRASDHFPVWVELGL